MWKTLLIERISRILVISDLSASKGSIDMSLLSAADTLVLTKEIAVAGRPHPMDQKQFFAVHVQRIKTQAQWEHGF
ncbi:hypothetical protein Lal_00022034 [Lupinus albus]|nr:hypothetical protein Lal_00022034 [Lupinus albus]